MASTNLNILEASRSDAPSIAGVSVWAGIDLGRYRSSV
jgi:hypothetical protein